MMLDLAGHLRTVSAPPSCGRQWQVQTALAIADGAPIGGDFIVFGPNPGTDRLQAVVVDASGKGAQAATRSVMLAGAISGLLGEVPSESLLPAVNRHILRLGWEEHFATAVHLDVDLPSGAYRLGVAGHPAPAHFDAGSGRWRLLRPTGPLLGVVSDAVWTQHVGRLAPGDALLVVTDGMIEMPGQDLEVGLDRMLGHAEHLVLSRFVGGAEQLLRQRRRVGRDDAQVLLVTRAVPSVPPPGGDVPRQRRVAPSHAPSPDVPGRQPAPAEQLVTLVGRVPPQPAAG